MTYPKLNNLESIDLTFNWTDKDGEEYPIKAKIDKYNWQQWGQPKEMLNENVNLIHEITNKVHEVIGKVMGIEE